MLVKGATGVRVQDNHSDVWLLSHTSSFLLETGEFSVRWWFPGSVCSPFFWSQPSRTAGDLTGANYRKVSNIRCTKSQNLNASSLVLQLSLPNPLKPDVKLRINKDVVGAAPTGDAPTTSEWWTILLPTKVWLILETYGTQKSSGHEPMSSGSARCTSCFFSEIHHSLPQCSLPHLGE